MSTLPTSAETAAPALRPHPLIGWGLLIGGACFGAGGAMHPGEDLPGAAISEQLRVMYADPAWYPSHALLLAGMAFMAAALVAVARDRRLSGVPRVRAVAVVAALATCVGTAGMLLHLSAATETEEIVAHHETPISDLHLIVDTVTVPVFSLSIAALAVAGARSRLLGNRVTAVPGVLGGLGYALAAATAAFTPLFDALFPAATGIALWGVAAGIGLLLRRSAADTAPRTA